MPNVRSKRLRVTRTIEIPDLVKISRYAKAPELGPRVLFFSGGTALHGLSHKIRSYTHNSIHLLTPFDSGGSSATLRQCFDMPAVGDLRHRLMALADESVLGSPEVYALFRHRLPHDASPSGLSLTLKSMAAGDHELVADIPESIGEQIRAQLVNVSAALPDDFDLRGASIGNLILTGSYLSNGRDLDATLELFSQLVSVRGTVRAVVNDNAHLGAVLSTGQTIIGQHRLTGKEEAPIDAAIDRVFLTERSDLAEPMELGLAPQNASLIGAAELICYAPGSFYSSLVATLLPHGVGEAIAQNGCPKVYIPNLGSDPEQFGMSFDQLVTQLVHYLTRDDSDLKATDVLNYVLVDRQRGRYPSAVSEEALQGIGIELLDVSLISQQSVPYYDDKRVLQVLLSLV